MMNEKKHYKAIVGNPTHAGTFILPEGKDIEYIVIDRIEERRGENVGGVKKDGAFAIFKPNPYTNLPFMLNVTNAKTLCFLAKKTPYELLDIKDLPVRLTSESTRIGEGLRVSKIPATPPTAKSAVPATPATPTTPAPATPAPATPATPTTPAPVAPAEPKSAPTEVLTLSHKNYPKCVEYIREGGAMDTLRTKYIISKEIEDAISSSL